MKNLNATQFGVTVADLPSENQPNQYSKEEVLGVFSKWSKTTNQPLDQDGGQAGDSD
jgi:hypothetical protein